MSDERPLAGLKRFMEREQAPKPRPGERCEMCGEPIGPEHSHVVNIQHRALMCVCRGCYLLFTHEGASLGRYRAVPDRYLYDPAFRLDAAQWEALQIPVAMAFFFANSTLGRFVAFYPSPAGATESLLPLDTWDEIIAANPAQVEKAKANPKLSGWFVGQVMKATGGKAAPAAVNEIVKRTLGIE